MAAALRSNTSRETASLTLSQFRYFIFNRVHTARAATPHCNHRAKSDDDPSNKFPGKKIAASARASFLDHRNSSKGYYATTNCAEKLSGGAGSATLSSQGDPPDLWQPPGDGVSVRLNGSSVNLGRGGGGGGGSGGTGAGNATGSNSKEDCWGGSNLGSDFPTPKEICKGLNKFVIGQERAKKVKNDDTLK